MSGEDLGDAVQQAQGRRGADGEALPATRIEVELPGGLNVRVAADEPLSDVEATATRLIDVAARHAHAAAVTTTSRIASGSFGFAAEPERSSSGAGEAPPPAWAPPASWPPDDDGDGGRRRGGPT